MKIFTKQPKITASDRKELRPLLTGYNYLVGELSSYPNYYSQDDLKKLILLELQGKKRLFILEKLTSRILTKERENIMGAIKECLKAG